MKMKYLVMVSDLVARQVYVDADSKEEALENANYGKWRLPEDVEHEEVVGSSGRRKGTTVRTLSFRRRRNRIDRNAPVGASVAECNTDEIRNQKKEERHGVNS
jgi:hypothetical protein